MTQTQSPQHTPDPLDRAAARIAALEARNDQLRQAMRSHAVVDQAIGVLIAIARIGPEQGWEVLREVSQHANIKLRQVAEEIIAWPRTGELRPAVRAVLRRRLDLDDCRRVPWWCAGPPGSGTAGRGGR
ncbi:hypothetical protein GCM10010358_80650 [Streptomyces minutiscleroticus]|uniref:ANTAR domain-containing protein n=1 Tax=Streptomyces minutiscleroticus TaxID=68238 RepID=A0A918P3J0_9ACTN|nr:hypothetical protein GCM10010358_80650 [Streptomyces minutiscleroticus]